MCIRFWTTLLLRNRFLIRNNFALFYILLHVIKITASVLGLLQVEPFREKMDGAGLTVALGKA